LVQKREFFLLGLAIVAGRNFYFFSNGQTYQVIVTKFDHFYAVNFSFLLNGQTYQVNLRSFKKLPAEFARFGHCCWS